MNSDFEKQLQRQPMKKLPEGWKAGIVQAAKAASVSQPSTKNAQPHWLYQLLWPCPQAWAGVAAVWVVIFFLNSSASDHAPVLAVVSAPPSQEIMVALRQQKMFKAELIGLAQPMEEPKRFIPQPRSEAMTETVAV